MDKIIGIGNALVDVLVKLKDEEILHDLQLPKGAMTFVDKDKIQKINHLFATMETHRVTGGSAGNAIRALSELGMEAGFIGKVGKDEFGDFYRQGLKTRGVHSNLLISDHNPSGVAYTFITPDGERTFADHLGAAATLSADELNSEMFAGYQYLFIEGYLVQDHDMIMRAVQLAHQEGVLICLDLASYNIVENDRAFFLKLVEDYVDIIFANEEEAETFSQLKAEQAVDKIAKMCSIAVVKRGAKGAIIRKGTEKVVVDALPVSNVVDTTGAGDYFAAGFLYGLMSGFSFERCANIGSLLSSEVIQVVGADLTPDRWKYLKKTILDY